MPVTPPSPSLIDAIEAYPRWLVALVGTVAGALLIWIGIKLLKVALYILLVLVIVGGIGATLYLFFH